MDLNYLRALFRCYSLLGGTAIAAWLAEPTLSAWLRSLRERLSARTRAWAVPVGVVSATLFLSCFLIHVGRHQFGAWDFNILLDVAWRQFTGQQPYVDFITPTPPFFNATALLAFRLFGPTWNANLYLSALFTSLAFLWSFALFRALGMRAVAALGTSLTIQIAAMLECSFWWYNNTTLVLAMLFFLASLLLARAPKRRLGQVSFVLLFGLLALDKPNIAGVTIASCLLILLFTSADRKRILLLSLGGVLLTIGLIAALHIPVAAMIATYQGVARERGGLSTFGFESLTAGEQHLMWIVMSLISLPLISLWRPLKADLLARRWRHAAFWLFFPVAALVATLGILQNGELRDVECTLLLAALALLAFVYRTDSLVWRRAVVAILCGITASGLYISAARLRVYTIGPHAFFEWMNNEESFTSGPLKDLRATKTMQGVDQQVAAAIHDTTGSIFFGPRLDFEYTVQKRPAPAHWSSFFQPGTAFARTETDNLIRDWKTQRFQELVFLKGEYTFYPRSLMEELETSYQRDDHFTYISVYRRRPGM